MLPTVTGSGIMSVQSMPRASANHKAKRGEQENIMNPATKCWLGAGAENELTHFGLLSFAIYFSFQCKEHTQGSKLGGAGSRGVP